ncbi:MAG: FG-GAP-like repeat-containing protein, partial [Rubripirellula sp.]
MEARRLLAAGDYGDAPSPYPVTLAEAGARHSDVGPRLGATRDSESDGTHSAAADADGSDEDGVTFDAIQVGQLDTTVIVNVQNAPSGAKLNAWIDFNADSNWGGPFDRIADNLPVVNGDNSIRFDVPSWAVAGKTFARFRLSSSGNLGIGGASNDGEVEDYEVTISPAKELVGDQWTQIVISSTANRAHDVHAADVDGDGDMDILAVSEEGNKVAWYENSGNFNFSERLIANSAHAPNSVFAVDIDGDGDIDVLRTSRANNNLAWHENDGNQNFTERLISNSYTYARHVFAADMDGDGDMDVVSAWRTGGDRFIWYENDGSENFTQHVFSVSAPNAHMALPVDVDKDGDMDVVAASYGNSTSPLGSDGKFSWYENDGDENFTERILSTTTDGAAYAFATDVDGDGDIDLGVSVAALGHILWFQNDGNQNFSERVISADVKNVNQIQAMDIDGDGDIDVVSSSQDGNRKIAWHINDGNENFTEEIISTQVNAASSVFTTDIDGDGDFDVLSASIEDDKIALYVKQANPTLEALSNLSINEDSAEQTVNLAGISAGGGESQPLRVTAISSSTGLIPNPTVTYTSPEATGSLKFIPVADQSGAATITVMVEDGGLDGNLSTADDNVSFARTFEVTVSAVNDAPTLDALSNLSINEDSAEQTVNLAGISAGGGESQPLRVTASSSTTGLIPNPTVTYTSPEATGNLKFTPVAEQSGAATITVTVEDGGLDGNLSTADDNASFERTFEVTVSAVNDAPTLDTLSNLSINEDSAEQTVNLAGISAGGGESQPLRVTASSGDIGLIPHPTVTYTSAETIGTLKFTPVADQSGTATITVTVEDGGPDGNLSTVDDNASFARTFEVTVSAVNDVPKLDALSNLSINEDSAEQTVSLAGISAGGGESQPLRVTAISSTTGIIPNPTVTYTSAETTGTLKFTPVADQSGTSTLTITVEDGGLDNDFETKFRGQGKFNPAENYSTGAFGRAMVMGDLDADGNLDAIVVNYSGENVVALLGQGDGSFGLATSITVGTKPSSVAVGDLNKDGHLDIATANFTSGTVSVLLGIGDGSFQNAVNLAVRASLSSIAMGDLDDDGDLDLVVGNSAENTSEGVSVLIGKGDGTFNTPADVATGHNSRPEDLVLADFNQDGHLDIATASGGSDTLGVLLGTGNGTFSSVVQYSVSDDPFGVAVGDFNNDGKLDLATSTWGGDSKVSLLLGDGAGSFGPVTHVDAGSNNFELDVADFNSDGRQDLMVVNDGTQHNLSLLLGRGDGTFHPRSVIAVTSPKCIVVEDVNGDGVEDVIVSSGSSQVSVLTSIPVEDNLRVTRTFDVTVDAVNDVPTLDTLSNLSINEDSAEQTVNLAGISAGGGESQPLRVTAISSSTGLIPNPTVTYTSPEATGSLKFTPVPDQSGAGTITVTVEDGGLDGNLSTADDNASFERTFEVTVSAVNDAPTLDTLSNLSINEDSAEQTV